jgi:hypothetical protein
MAWPVSSRFIDFIANVTAIAHDFLNAVQDAVVNLYGGVRTVVSLRADGVGDQVAGGSPGDIRGVNLIADTDVQATGGDVRANAGNVRAVAGHLEAGQMKIGTSMPTPSCALGQVYKDLIPIGWGRFVYGGGAVSMSSGVNIKSVVRNDVGDYTITLGTAPPLPGFHGVAFAMAYSDPDVSFWCQTSAEAVTGNMQVNLHSRSIGGTPDRADASFFMVALCG